MFVCLHRYSMYIRTYVRTYVYTLYSMYVLYVCVSVFVVVSAFPIMSVSCRYGSHPASTIPLKRTIKLHNSAPIGIHMHTHTRMHTHAHTHMHTHTHARTHACTHAHTHTHTHRELPASILKCTYVFLHTLF